MDKAKFRERVLQFVVEYKRKLGAFETDSGQEYGAYVNEQQYNLLKRIKDTASRIISKMGVIGSAEYQRLIGIAKNVLDEHEVKMVVKP